MDAQFLTFIIALSKCDFFKNEKIREQLQTMGNKRESQIGRLFLTYKRHKEPPMHFEQGAGGDGGKSCQKVFFFPAFNRELSLGLCSYKVGCNTGGR